MKLRSNQYIALFALFGILLLAGCDNVFSPISANSGNQDGLTISVSDEGQGARTLFPSAVFTKYELSFAGPEGSTHPQETLTGGSNSITVYGLAEGLWTITAVGYVLIDGIEYAAAQGSQTINIFPGSQIINIPITASQSGNDGFFSYSVTFPPTVDYADIVFYEYGTGRNEHNIDLLSQPSGMIENLPPGYYIMRIELSDGYQIAGKTEIVHIYSNMETRAEYVFTAADFVETITLSGTVIVEVNGMPINENAVVYAYKNSGWGHYLLSRININSDGTWSLKIAPYTTAETLFFWVLCHDGLDEHLIDTGVSRSVLDANISNIELGTFSFILDFPPSSHTPLINNQWEDGEIINPGDEEWYSFTVTSGTDYYIWFNNITLNGARIRGWYDDGTEISDINSWSGFQAVKNGTVYIRVRGYYENSTGTYGIVYNTTGIHPLYLPSNITALIDSQWEDGEIFNYNDADWYSIDVTSGTDYYIWWNDRIFGDGTKTLQYARASAWYSDGTAIFNADYDGWNSYRSFTASITGTVYIAVSSSLPGSTGTYGIVYSTSSTRPSTIVFPSSHTALTDGQWEDGEIFNSGDEEWYSLNVTSETDYYIWLNYRGDGIGDGTKGLLQPYISAWDSNGTDIFINQNGEWSSYQSFTANITGTVYIRVSSLYTGTYGIVYSTGSTRPSTIVFPSSHTALTVNQWEDGEIFNSGDEEWYSFNVTSETNYYIWLNYSNGDGTKTLDNTNTSAWYSDGTAIFINQYANNWAYPLSFTANITGTVYVRVRSDWNTGTYGIVCSTSSTRPSTFVFPSSHTALTANQWEDGEIFTAGDEDWYSLNVSGGAGLTQMFRVWFNSGDYGNGDGTKTLQHSSVSAWYSDGTAIFIDASGGWNSSISFIVAPYSTYGSTVYIRVRAWDHGSDTGTYGIVYSNSSTRPSTFVFPSGYTVLTAGQWEDGEIFAPGYEDWYSIDVTSGTDYYIWCNDSLEGKTLFGGATGGSVGAWYGNGTEIFINQDTSEFAIPRTFTAASTGTVYIRVSSTSNTGTYGIVYSTSSLRPLDLPANITALTDGQWEDGVIFNQDDSDWYSINVTSGTDYYVWWNAAYVGGGDGTKTLVNPYVSAWYSDGTAIFTFSDDGFTTPQTFTAASTGTVYIRVSPGYYGTGTYGIVYTKNNSTRPPVVIVPPVFTLYNINSTQQGEALDWFIFGLFPAGTTNADVLSDAKAHKNGTMPSTAVAYAGGETSSLSWEGDPPNISISSTLISASDHISAWNGSGPYDSWALVYDGSVWNGYRLTINVQGDVNISATAFNKIIIDEP
ncbi:MAG: hypothetical protein FWG99_05440 [Treponema sp.]|nr:hypothetical protein [Treponema sp.]